MRASFFYIYIHRIDAHTRSLITKGDRGILVGMKTGIDVWVLKI